MKQRVVVDTQVWLDWLHFDDPRCARLERSFRADMLEIVIDGACREEWLRVVGYPVLGLAADRQAELVEMLDARATLLDLRQPVANLPRCRDRDDQKFIQLAVAACATLLLTRDRALLDLHRRLLREFGLAVIPPDQFTTSVAEAGAPS